MPRALIIDDSKAIRVILKKMLLEVGMEVFEAENGQQAIERLREMMKCDIALVDWNMPIMNGLDFVKHVRAISFFKNMKIMMVTTESEINRMQLALEEGADEYVMKPFTKEIILDKLVQLGIITSSSP